MIWIKTILFFFALIVSIIAIEDFVEKIISHSKTNKDEFYVLYSTGLIDTINFGSTLIAVLLWTALYFVNHV